MWTRGKNCIYEYFLERNGFALSCGPLKNVSKKIKTSGSNDPEVLAAGEGFELSVYRVKLSPLVPKGPDFRAS